MQSRDAEVKMQVQVLLRIVRRIYTAQYLRSRGIVTKAQERQAKVPTRVI